MTGSDKVEKIECVLQCYRIHLRASQSDRIPHPFSHTTSPLRSFSPPLCFSFSQHAVFPPNACPHFLFIENSRLLFGSNVVHTCIFEPISINPPNGLF